MRSSKNFRCLLAAAGSIAIASALESVKTIDHNWGKYPLDSPNNVALDHLSRDVGDESLLRNLMRSY
jgi:hypothetical protein